MNGRARFLVGMLLALVTLLPGCGGGGSGGGEPVPVSPPAPPSPPIGTLTLVAGSLDLSSSGQGTADGNGAQARFIIPAGLALDTSGNVYVADSSANTIRRISPAGGVTTVAGSPGLSGTADGAGNVARFMRPASLAFGKDGLLYVLDGWQRTPFSLLWQAIRTVSPQGEVKTEFGPVGAGAPGIGFDAAGNFYLSNAFSLARIGSDKVVTKLAQAFNQGMTVAPDGSVYYIEGNCIRKLSSAGVMTTVAGDVTDAGSADGTGAQARFSFSLFQGRPVQGGAIVVDSVGNLYAGDNFNHTVRKVTPAGVVTTVAGVPGAAGVEPGNLPARLSFPNGLALLDDKTLFVSSGNAVLKISLP